MLKILAAEILPPTLPSPSGFLVTLQGAKPHNFVIEMIIMTSGVRVFSLTIGSKTTLNSGHTYLIQNYPESPSDLFHPISLAARG